MGEVGATSGRWAAGVARVSALLADRAAARARARAARAAEAARRAEAMEALDEAIAELRAMADD
ncbi:MAG: hypothetical protein ACK4WC_10545 [Rubrimonas sp.]